MSRRNLTVLLAGVMISLLCYGRKPADLHARYVAEAYDEIDRSALFQPTDQDLVAGAMKGMVQVLRNRGDEHSGYTDPRQSERFMADIRQQFGGVGVHIRFEGEPPRLTIAGPPEPNTPASRAGIRSGDFVDAIDGASTAELVTTAGSTPQAMEKVLDLMRGPVGKPVVLTIDRVAGDAAEQLTVTLVRDEIEVPSVLGDRRRADGGWEFRLEEEPRIALLRVTSFGNKTLGELQRIVPQLSSEGVEAFVFDLRDDPGGALDVAIDVCDLFLPKGAPIVETRGRDQRTLSRFVASGGPFTAPPLAVLINDQSASAAEIMAACLQDNGRALTVGERSFGKGTVQRIAEMQSGRTLLKLTTATFVRPSGVNIHRMPGEADDAAWGVRPDEGLAIELTDEQKNAWRTGRAERDLTVIEAPSPEGEAGTEAEPWSDAVLQRAVETLTEQLRGA